MSIGKLDNYIKFENCTRLRVKECDRLNATAIVIF